MATVADRIEWQAIKRGNGLPVGAVLAGQTSGDGDLYVGRNKNGEIGKLNTDKGLMYNIWCHDAGGSSEGDVLVVKAGCSTSWVKAKKGDDTPENACMVSSTKQDGDMAPCRKGENGDVGKVNFNPGKVNNFWYKGDWSATGDGEILCVGPNPAGASAGGSSGGYKPAAEPSAPSAPASGGIASGTSVFFRAHTGKHIEVQGEDVAAHWDDHGDYQRLKIESAAGGSIQSGSTVFLTAHTGKVVEAEADVVKARFTDKLDWQKFVIDKDGGGAINPGDKVFLKAHTGKYVDVENEGKVQARYDDRGDWQRLTIEVGSGGGGGGAAASPSDCQFPHELSIQGGKLQIVVTPKNPSEVSLVSVHYNINEDGQSKWNFETTNNDNGRYVLQNGVDCKSGDKVAYWFCCKVNGLMVSDPDGAHPGGSNSNARMFWTAP